MSIAPQTLTVLDAYKDFYGLPGFQRSFRWTPENVQEFIGDLLEQYNANETAYLGQIITYHKDELHQIVDGQQRMTTLFLLFAAIRDILAACGDSSNSLENVLRDIHVNGATGAEENILHLVPRKSETRDELSMIAETVGASMTPGKTAMGRALATLRKNLDDVFRGDARELRPFMGYVLRHCKIVRVSCDTLPLAYKLFRLHNARGQSLDPSEIIKSELLGYAGEAREARAEALWSEVEELSGQNLSRLRRMLRYYFIGHFGARHKNKILPAGQIYSWFNAHADEIGATDNTIKFLEDLRDAVHFLSEIAKGRLPDGQVSDSLTFLRSLAPNITVPHMALMALRHRPASEIDRLAGEIEKYGVNIHVNRLDPKQMETDIGRWIPHLHAVSSRQDLEDFIAAHITPVLEDLSPLTYGKLVRAREGHDLSSRSATRILTRIAQHLENTGRGARLSFSEIDGKLSREHIFPQKPSTELAEGFASDWQDWVGRLGNLTLTEQPINTSAGNRPYCEKRERYTNSAFLITSLLGDSSGHAHSSLKDLIEAHPTADNWTPAAIEARQNYLANVAISLWNR